MNRFLNQGYRIAGLSFEIQSDTEFQCSEEFRDFVRSGRVDYCIEFRETDELKTGEDKAIANEVGFAVYKTDEAYLYQYFDTNHIPYAVSTVDLTERTVLIQYLKHGLRHISHTRGAFFHIRWEELLLNANRMILHACCVETAYGGILFSGASGVGKSTQGDLWCRYENAKLINGDRPILYKNEEWYAYGSPYAGSSRCHVNEKTKVRTIVLLAQSKQCSIRKLGKAEAFRNIFAQLTIAAWNSESVQHACELVEQLISDVPVYVLACTPDKDAVDLLKATIEEEV